MKTEEKMNCANCFSPNEKFCSGCGRSNTTVEEAMAIDDAIEKELETNVTAMKQNLQLLNNATLLFAEEHREFVQVESLIRSEIASRGLNSDGVWIGFDNSRRYWNDVEAELLGELINEVTPADEGEKALAIDEFIRVKSDIILELGELRKLSMSVNKQRVNEVIDKILKNKCDVEISEFSKSSMSITEFVNFLLGE